MSAKNGSEKRPTACISERLSRDYRLLDWGTQGYSLLVTILILFFHNETVPRWYLLVAAHLVTLTLVHLLISYGSRPNANKFLIFLRTYYPIILYTGFYRETGLLNRMFIRNFIDPWLIEIEQYLFGCQPSILFMDILPYRWFAELMYASYFSYYIMIAGLGFVLFLRNRKACQHFVTVVSLLFYFCYLTYIFIPACGPRIFWFPYKEIPNQGPFLLVGDQYPFPKSVTSALFFKIMAFIYEHFEATGAAFPSSHIAVAWCTVFFSFLYLPRLRWPHTITALLLTASTVYGRYHYVIDVIAGLLTVAILLPSIHYLYKLSEYPLRCNLIQCGGIHNEKT